LKVAGDALEILGIRFQEIDDWYVGDRVSGP
jgi:hypothetical protein